MESIVFYGAVAGCVIFLSVILHLYIRAVNEREDAEREWEEVWERSRMVDLTEYRRNHWKLDD